MMPLEGGGGGGGGGGDIFYGRGEKRIRYSCTMWHRTFKNGDEFLYLIRREIRKDIFNTTCSP